jgi:hypothetical protein
MKGWLFLGEEPIYIMTDYDRPRLYKNRAADYFRKPAKLNWHSQTNRTKKKKPDNRRGH